VSAVRARWALPGSLFLGSFAWSFVFVSLPFYIHRMSPLDEAATLRWTGWILGISSLVTVVTAPISGRLAARRSPKQFYVAVQFLQSVGFFLMALARTLPQMLAARLLLGLMGASSTFAFIMASRHGDARRGVAAIQSAMTLGQVLGPPVGAIAAARIGFVESFLVGGVLLWVCGALVGFGVPPQAPPAAGSARAGRVSPREVVTACLLVLVASSQIFFLPAILPQVLPRLGVAADDTLEVGGLVIFASGLAAALGSMAAPRLAEHIGERRAVAGLLAASSALMGALGAATGPWSFAVVRFFQVLCIAPIFPLSVARIAQRASGGTIGLVNSSRIGAAFLGPVVATTLLSWAPPLAVYLVLALPGLALVPVLAERRRWRRGPGDRAA
jgi:MFS transporter, DHA1 family, multidrug resistance protein